MVLVDKFGLFIKQEASVCFADNKTNILRKHGHDEVFGITNDLYLTVCVLLAKMSSGELDHGVQLTE